MKAVHDCIHSQSSPPRLIHRIAPTPHSRHDTNPSIINGVIPLFLPDSGLLLDRDAANRLRPIGTQVRGAPVRQNEIEQRVHRSRSSKSERAGRRRGGGGDGRALPEMWAMRSAHFMPGSNQCSLVIGCAVLPSDDEGG
jgi:hypothetical protein